MRVSNLQLISNTCHKIRIDFVKRKKATAVNFKRHWKACGDNYNCQKACFLIVLDVNSSPLLKMKTTNIGIVLLTLLVVTKYYISLNTYSNKDGALKSGIVFDYSLVPDYIAALSQSTEPQLLALNEVNSENSGQVTSDRERSENTSQNNTKETEVPLSYPVFENELPETLPMEHSNSLVVFDPSNPVLANMKTTYTDQYDEASPLDNGNTLVDEMQTMMPRR